LLLADSPEEEYNRKHASAHLYQGGMDTVQRILTFIKRLIGVWFQLFHHRFVAWTKPNTTSLMLGTLTDLARGKSELVAENALLRQQLIILRRQVKRPACTKTDRMLLVLLARAGRDLEASAFYRSARDAPALASAGIQAVLEIQVQSGFCQTKDLCRDCGFDQGDGKQQSALGSRTYSWRIAQVGSTCL
jgi:hypothetical protein